MKNVAFLNQKGGVGKTTSAVTIGAFLAAEHGKRVLLVDLDPQGNLSDHLGIDPGTTERSVYNVLLGDMGARQAIHSVHGLDVIPANLDLSGAEVELAGVEHGRETRLRDALAPLAADYDFVLIDCPPSLGLLTVSALAFADAVIVPMQAEYLALRGLSQLVQTVDLVKDHLNPTLEVAGVIFCMYDPRTNLAKDVHGEVESYFPGKVFRVGIRKNIRLAESPSHGMPIHVYDPHCAGAEDYREATREFLSRARPPAPEPARREPIWRGDGGSTLSAPDHRPASGNWL